MTHALLRAGRTTAIWGFRILMWLLLLAAIAVLAVTIAIPRALGATPYAIMTGSMEPAMPPGTLVVVDDVDPSDIGIGSVITFQVRSGDPTVATHRVVATGINNGQTVFQTKGDANDVPDNEWVKPVQIKGEVRYQVPYLGHAHTALSFRQRQFAVYALAGGLAAYATAMFGSAWRDRRARRLRTA